MLDVSPEIETSCVDNASCVPVLEPMSGLVLGGLSLGFQWRECEGANVVVVVAKLSCLTARTVSTTFCQIELCPH